MIFKPLQYDSGRVKQLVVNTQTTIAKGDPLTFTGGLAVKAVNTETTAVRFVALEGVTSATAGAKILALEVRGVEFEASTKNNTDQDQVGGAFLLHTDGTVDNGSAGHIFVVTQLVGPVTAKKVRGYFLDRVNA